jgi:hypothetical protein
MIRYYLAFIEEGSGFSASRNAIIETREKIIVEEAVSAQVVKL